jgi:hypothetical protein
VERQSARLNRGFIGQAELELHQLQEIRMLFHWSIVDVDVENGLQCNNRVSKIYTMLTWHECSERYLKKKSLFSCHLPSALFLTQKSAHVICFRYQKYHTYFFAIGLCFARPPKHMSSWHAISSPSGKKTKNTWTKTWVCPMTPFIHIIFTSMSCHHI